MKKSYADYHINPAKKKGGRRRRRNVVKRKVRRARRAKRKLRNPVPYGIVLVNSVRRKKARRAKRRRNSARRASRRPSVSSVPTKNPSPMKTRRRGRRRHRNASRRRTSRRRSVMSLRNPVRRRGRRSSRRMRNPVSGIVGDIFSSDNLTLGAGIVTGQVGGNIIINKLRSSQMAANGSLPGLNPAAPSAIGIMLWKMLISLGSGYLLRNQAPRFARGLILGGVAGAMSDLLVQTRALSMIPGATAGTGRMLAASRGMGRGAGAFLPGTSSRFMGPASQFLQPQRNGMSARVGPGLINQLPGMVAPAFGN